MKNYYSEIDKELKSYEENKSYHTKTLDWIANRIEWCHKWKHITEKQCDELCDRMIILFERGY